MRFWSLDRAGTPNPAWFSGLFALLALRL